MRFKVLTPKERRILRQVRTTKKQAAMIKRRNLALIEILDRESAKGPRPDSRQILWWNVDIGCPHCLAVGRYCTACSWKIPALRKRVEPQGSSFMCFCTSATFGGVSNPPLSVYYGNRAAVTFSGSCWTNGPEWDKAVGDTRHYLQGHVEWADAVLKGWWKRRKGKP
jgi:hypothetical protein